MAFQAPESLAEQIAQHLIRLIVTGQIKPRERIQELKVAGELEVSRGSVREALLLLQRRHVIEIFPRKGAVVTDLTVDHVTALYDMVEGLVSMLSVRFANAGRPEDLERMATSLKRLESLIAKRETTDVEVIMNAGLELIKQCYPVVQNPYLEQTLESFRPAISRTYYLALMAQQQVLGEMIVHAREVVDAITTRDLTRIPEAISRLSAHQKQIVIDVLAEKTVA